MELTTKRRMARPLLAVVAGVLLLAGCGGDAEPEGAPEDETPASTAAETTEDETTGGAAEGEATTDGDDGMEEVVITIADFSYQVPDTVPAGAEITVTNEDDVGHTVTSDEEGVFDVAVGPGETVTFTAPEDPGEYGFYCIPHPDMTSTLVVG